MPWHEYIGGGPARDAIIGGAALRVAWRAIELKGRERISLTRQGHHRARLSTNSGSVGSVAGIYTASMPVFVVRNTRYGNTGYCNFL